MPDPAFCTFEDVLANGTVKTETDKALIEGLCLSVTAAFQKEMSRKIFRSNYVHRANGDGQGILRPWETPIATINSLKDTGIVIPADPDGAGGGYQFDDDAVWLTSGVFRTGRRNVVLEYVGGYSLVPADLARAAVAQVAYEYGRKLKLHERSTSMGDQTVNNETAPFLEGVAKVLSNYTPRTLHG